MKTKKDRVFIWNPIWGIPLIGKIDRQEACSVAEKERDTLDEQASLYLCLLAKETFLVKSKLSSHTLARKGKIIINTMADPFSPEYKCLYPFVFSLIQKGKNRERDYLLFTKENLISSELPANVSVFSLSSLQFLQGDEKLWQKEIKKLLGKILTKKGRKKCKAICSDKERERKKKEKELRRK